MADVTETVDTPAPAPSATLAPSAPASGAPMKVLLLDGNSLTYRAFFALPTDMATASGQVTNAVFGFTSMLINLLKDHRPDAILVAFDRPEPTFRHVANPEYKAQREAAPDILRQQMGLVRQVLEALRIQIFELAGWEADDIIATIATKAEAEGHDVVIVTGDRDSYQLVRDPHIKVLYNRRGVSDYAFYDEAGILERTGVTPAQYPEYAALRGDPSDNLPGVPGVGEKTAAKLITTYGGLDGIFANVDNQTPKLRQNLVDNEAQARSNHEMMVLRHDAPVDPDLTTLVVDPDQAEVRRLFDFLEFKSLYERLYEALGAAGSVPAVSTAEVLHAEVREASSAAAVAAMIEGLATLDLAASWAGEPGRTALTGLAVVVDPAVADVVWVPEMFASDPVVLAAVAAHGRVRAHHVKALMRSMLGQGLVIDGLQLDTAIAAYLIDPAETRYAVGDLLEKYTDYQLATAVDPSSKGQLDFGGGDDGRERAGCEALAVTHLADALESALTKQGMVELYRTIENPLVRVLAKMEHVGIAVDVAELRSLNERLTADCDRLTAELQAIVGRPFNINSPIQLRDILYTERGLAPGKKTKTGFSTDAATLEKLRDQWPEFIDPLAAVPRGGEAPRDVRHGAVAGGGVRRPHPRHVQPDRRPHRPAQQRPAEPAQHPGAQRRRTPVPQGVRARVRTSTARRRLQPDRVALHRPPRRRPRSARGVPERHRHPQRHGGTRVRRVARRRHGGDAVEGEDGELRPRLRDGGLRSRAATRHSHR